MVIVMIHSRLRALVGLAVALFSSTTWAEELVVPGSGNPELVLRALAEEFGRRQTQHQVVVPSTTGTAGALRDVEAGKAVLGRVGRPLKSDELARGLVFIPIGRDPVAFVGGAAVTATNLTHAQVLAAYTGTVSDWREIGGKPGPIRVIGRETTDASRQAISRVIKPFENIVYSDRVKLVHLDPQMIELLDRYPTSLGFLNRSGLAACKTKIVYLSVDGIEPTPQNVGAGRYPFWQEFGLIHKTGSLPPAAKAFVDFVRSPTGIGILRARGVLAAAGSS